MCLKLRFQRILKILKSSKILKLCLGTPKIKNNAALCRQFFIEQSNINIVLYSVYKVQEPRTQQGKYIILKKDSPRLESLGPIGLNETRRIVKVFSAICTWKVICRAVSMTYATSDLACFAFLRTIRKYTNVQIIALRTRYIFWYLSHKNPFCHNHNY